MVRFYLHRLFSLNLFKGSGSHLLSHAVSSIVSSAASVLTIVFGMGTGVSPKRIATGNVVIKFFLGNSTVKHKSLLLLPKKGGDPAAPSDTATLLRLHPSFRSRLRQLPPCGWVTDFGHYQLPWCDGRCVQDPGTYSPQHSDLRLLAIPASCSRVADYNPN